MVEKTYPMTEKKSTSQNKFIIYTVFSINGPITKVALSFS